MRWLEQCQLTIASKGLLDKDSDYNGEIGKALLELCEAFSKQGHSGMSASWTAELFSRLVKYNGFLSQKDYDKALKDFMENEGLKFTSPPAKE